MKHRKSRTTEIHYYSDRLKQKLSQLRFAPATVVEAPSGYGKTTALRDVLKHGIPQGTPVHWFAAVEESPQAGFRRLCCTINKIDNRAGERLLKIGLPNSANVGEACDALQSIQCNQETYLVIDNFQIIQSFLSVTIFSALVEHGGKGLHIIIITQILKHDNIAALAGRKVLHITAADLRLNAIDIQRYYALAGFKIGQEDAKELAHYTEGWITAVYLQLCAFRENISIPVTTGIVFLMEQLVWDSLTDQQQVFLLHLVIFQIKPGFKFQIIRNRFSGFYGTFCTLFKEKITDFAHNHFISDFLICLLQGFKNNVDMTQLWILMDNSSSYPQTPQLLGQHCALPTYPQQLPLPQLFF